MRKIFIILCTVMCSVCVNGQKLGDYMEIDGVPGFVFYLDETGEHGLVMSMWPIMVGWEKTQTKSLRKEGIITEEHMKKLSFSKEEMKKMSKNKSSHKEMKKYYSELSKLLGDDGEENRKIIQEYCNNNNLPLSIFKGQAFAASLGEGWFIPGDNEVTKFSIFLAGGVGENFLIPYKNLNTILKGQFNNPIAQCIIRWILPNSTGLLSSTIKHDTGFRILSSAQKGFKGIYFKIYDCTKNGTPITIAQPQVRTCAVHKF